DLAGMRVQLANAPEAAELRPLGLGGLLLGAGVLERVADVVAEVRRSDDEVALIADEREMAGPRGEVKAYVASSLAVRRVTLPEPVHADAATLAYACAESSGASVILSVGSGTIVDIGKAVSARLGGVPHVAVQTAASV